MHTRNRTLTVLAGGALAVALAGCGTTATSPATHHRHYSAVYTDTGGHSFTHTQDSASQQLLWWVYVTDSGSSSSRPATGSSLTGGSWQKAGTAASAPSPATTSLTATGKVVAEDEKGEPDDAEVDAASVPAGSEIIEEDTTEAQAQAVDEQESAGDNSGNSDSGNSGNSGSDSNSGSGSDSGSSDSGGGDAGGGD